MRAAIFALFAITCVVHAIPHEIGDFTADFNMTVPSLLKASGRMAHGSDSGLAVNLTSGIQDSGVEMKTSLRINRFGNDHLLYDPVEAYLFSDDICWELNGPIWSFAIELMRIPGNAKSVGTKMVNGRNSQGWEFYILDATITIWLDVDHHVPTKISISVYNSPGMIIIDFSNIVVGQPSHLYFAAPPQKCISSVPGRSAKDELLGGSQKMPRALSAASPPTPNLTTTLTTKYKVYLPYISTFDSPNFHGEIVIDRNQKGFSGSLRGSMYFPMSLRSDLVIPVRDSTGYAYSPSDCVYSPAAGIVWDFQPRIPAGSEYLGTRIIKGVKCTGWKVWFGVDMWVDIEKNTPVVVAYGAKEWGNLYVYFYDTELKADVKGIKKPSMKCKPW